MNQNIPLNISPKELNKILEDDSSEKPFISEAVTSKLTKEIGKRNFQPK